MGATKTEERENAVAVHRVEAAARHQKIEQLHRKGSGGPKRQ